MKDGTVTKYGYSNYIGEGTSKNGYDNHIHDYIIIKYKYDKYIGDGISKKYLYNNYIGDGAVAIIY